MNIMLIFLVWTKDQKLLALLIGTLVFLALGAVFVHFYRKYKG